MNMTHWLPVSTVLAVAWHLPSDLMSMGRLRSRLWTGQRFSSVGDIPPSLLPALSLLMFRAPATMVLVVEGERTGFEEAEAWAQSVSGLGCENTA